MDHVDVGERVPDVVGAPDVSQGELDVSGPIARIDPIEDAHAFAACAEVPHHDAPEVARAAGDEGDAHLELLPVVEERLHAAAHAFDEADLGVVAEHRARMLAQGHTPKVESKDKPTVTALTPSGSIMTASSAAVARRATRLRERRVRTTDSITPTVVAMPPAISADRSELPRAATPEMSRALPSPTPARLR